MHITRNVFPIADLYNWFADGTLKVNKNYQRSSGLWPLQARSYFIDTILNEFPFPKVTMRQIIDISSGSAVREIVDGQQRLTTIRDFKDNKFRLTTASKKYVGNTFEQLDEDVQSKFLAYEVSVDAITIGTEEDVLEIFRRMNSYTLPLKGPEKRHATYQGAFKWYIVDLTEQYSPFFEKAKILSIRNISRMEDADLLTELTQVVLVGIAGRSESKLDSLYKENNESFDKEKECQRILSETINYIKNELSILIEYFEIPSYVFYSLFAALVFNRFSLPNIVGDDTVSNNEFCKNKETAIERITDIMRDVLDKETEGNNKEFVQACISTTHSQKNRETRTKYLLKAIQAD